MISYDLFPKLSIDGSEGFQLDFENKMQEKILKKKKLKTNIKLDYAFTLSWMRDKTKL